jgi:hypothetical protein
MRHRTNPAELYDFSPWARVWGSRSGETLARTIILQIKNTSERKEGRRSIYTISLEP